MNKIVLLVAFLSFVCCSTKEEPAAPAPSKSRVDPFPIPLGAEHRAIDGKYGGGIVTAIISDLSTFNPILSYDADAQAFNQLMCSGLTRLNLLTQQPDPALAKTWEPAEDQLTWTFHLREGIRWSDGHPFTAADVVFTMDIVNDPRIASGAQDALTIDGKRIEWHQADDLTVVAKLPSIFAPFLRFLDGGTVPILPKHKWEKAYHDGKFEQSMQVNMDPRDFVSLGPFVLNEYKQGERISLIRNPHYWKVDSEGRRLPYLDQITFLILSGQDQLLLRMANGEIDTSQSIRPKDVDELMRNSKTTKLNVVNLGPSYENEQLFFNQNGGRNPKNGKPYLDSVKRSWFTNTNFRKAVAYAIDRESMVNTILYGNGIPAYGPESVSNQMWYNDAILKTPRDPAKALELLKSSGFVQKIDTSGNVKLYDSRGHEVRFSLHTNAGNSMRNAQCNMILSDLAKLGIKVDYAAIEFNNLVDRVTSSFDFDAVLLSLSQNDVDPSSGMNIWPSSGSLHFWWPAQKKPQTEWEKRIDELMISQFSTFDNARRKEQFNEVQRIITEQQPIIFTINPFLFVCAREGIGNFKPALTRHRTLWNSEELYWNNPGKKSPL